GRAVGAALPRAVEAVGPGCRDAADEVDLGVGVVRQVDGDLAGAYFVQPDHGSAVEADHDVRRLDDGIGLLADLEAELVDRLVGDRGRDDGAMHVEPDVGSRRTLLDFDNLALQPIPGADLHNDPHVRAGMHIRPSLLLEQAVAWIAMPGKTLILHHTG